MARAPRVQYSGACYHVIQRGNNGEAIFKQDIEKFFFLKILRIFTAMFNCSVMAYTVLDNHYHVLIRIHAQNLSKVMHRLNSRYAHYYNWRHKREGHVFQGRFQAYLIKDDRHLVTVLRYIHQNALRANIAENISDYYWCSDHDYREPGSGWVHTAFILDIFSRDRQEAQLTYRRLMGEKVTEKEKRELFRTAEYEEIEKEAAAESAAAVASLEASEEIAASLSPAVVSWASSQLDQVLRSCCSNNEEFELIKKGSRLRTLRDKKISYIMQSRVEGYTLEEIGANISMTRHGVSKLISR